MFRSLHTQTLSDIHYEDGILHFSGANFVIHTEIQIRSCVANPEYRVKEEDLKLREKAKKNEERERRREEQEQKEMKRKKEKREERAQKK
jgi:hypothetical protein